MRNSTQLINSEFIPKTITKLANTNKIMNSVSVISVNLEICIIFHVPNTIRFNKYIEYIAERIIPNPEKVKRIKGSFTTKEFAIPKKIKNSPMKLDVPGKLIFAIVNKKNKMEYKGIDWTNPPK